MPVGAAEGRHRAAVRFVEVVTLRIAVAVTPEESGSLATRRCPINEGSFRLSPRTVAVGAERVAAKAPGFDRWSTHSPCTPSTTRTNSLLANRSSRTPDCLE